MIPLLSWTGIGIAYVCSVAEGFLPGCVPHLAGCTSISAAGRHGAGFLVFKVFVLPAALCLHLYWWQSYRWLASCGDPVAWRSLVLVAGSMGAAMLILYTCLLGLGGDRHDEVRRYAAALFFGFCGVGSLLVTARMSLIVGRRPWVATQIALCVIILLEGLVLATTSARVQDAAEWRFMTALSLHPLVTWMVWRSPGFQDGARCDC